MDIFEALKSSYLFAPLSKNILWRIASLCTKKSFKIGEYLCHQNDEGDDAFIIASGTVEIFHELQDGSKIILSEVGIGEILGELALIDGLPRSASMVATSPVEALSIGTWDFQAQLQAFPEIALQLLPIIAKRLRKTQEQLIQLGSTHQ